MNIHMSISVMDRLKRRILAGSFSKRYLIIYVINMNKFHVIATMKIMLSKNAMAIEPLPISALRDQCSLSVIPVVLSVEFLQLNGYVELILESFPEPYMISSII